MVGTNKNYPSLGQILGYEPPVNRNFISSILVSPVPISGVFDKWSLLKGHPEMEKSNAIWPYFKNFKNYYQIPEILQIGI